MAIGVIIMGWGFFFMSIASKEVGYDATGQVIAKSGMQWLVLAYLFHTLGELCASPVALSFITKLAPERWMAFMMGAYFAATGCETCVDDASQPVVTPTLVLSTHGEAIS